MRLFEPGQVGTMKLKNRVVMAPMFCMGMTYPSSPYGYSQRGVDYYEARAKGGTGLIISGVMAPNERMEASWGFPVLNDRKVVAWLNDVVERVHDHRAKFCVQFSAGFGRQGPPNYSLPHGGLTAPSPVSAFFDQKVTCRELATEEIDQFVRDFELGAGFIKMAGVDAVEIHAHQGYLLDEFVTARTNWRTDKYGGTFENRLRIIVELFHAVKRAAGPGFPVIFRYGLTHHVEKDVERGNNKMEGARDIEEGLKIARYLEAEGIDALHVDAGVYETNNWAQPPEIQPDGCLVYLAELAKKEVKIPIISVGKLGHPELAEEVLRQGKADFIALGRPLLADPEWANKVQEGRWEDIRPCLGDHEGCLSRLARGQYLSCTVNPQCGNERNLAIAPADKKKRVVVVGGGPGGMEAARVASLRGHRVTLFEQSPQLGGNLITAGRPPFKKDYLLYRDYLTTQLKKQRVKVRLKTKATPEAVLELKPDAVFIATGAIATTCDIPGSGRAQCLSAVDLLLQQPEVGANVVVIGGGMVGAETALYLGRQGRHVTIVEMLDDIMRDAFWINALDVKRRFAGLEEDDVDVTVLTNTRAVEVTEQGVVVEDQQGSQRTLAADTVVIAAGMRPNDDGLAASLADKVPQVYAIGDCVEVGKVKDAVWAAFRTARLI